MPPLIRNILAVILAVVVGSSANMALIMLSPSLIPPPPGVDVNNAESLANSIHLFGPQHFLMPFLAHAVGTLVGAITARLVAASYQTHLAYGIGGFFLLGGIAASTMIPAPTWFIALDLVCAYLPMAWLGIQIGNRLKSPAA